MPGKVTDLEAVRCEKAPLCDYCGGPEHKGTFECPRIKSVTFDNEEDTITIRLYPTADHRVVAGGE